jgi:NAD(P)-dependent dehydrogenase (short-subunit alcohol dehydrogenase family)
MKVAVTGHTSGIGQGLYRYFADQGHEVHGYSRSNGYTLPGAATKIIAQSLDCDIFVNNAFTVQGQIDLLRLLWPRWKLDNKTIVIIGSLVTSLPYPMEGHEEYQQLKQELDALCNEYRYSNDAICKIISIHPGAVATKVKNQDPAHCMSVDEVVQIVDYVLHAPVSIKDITFAKL